MYVGIAIVAAAAGAICAIALERLIRRERQALGLPLALPRTMWLRVGLVTAAIIGTCELVVWCELAQGCLNSPGSEVQPSEFGRQARAAYHCVLVTLLILATVIDLDCYILPDQLTMTGLVVGVVGAVAFRELQIAHLWVDWAYAVPQLRGPYIPEWYDRYRWLHALAWSLTGAIAGGAVTQLVRWLSRTILGQEAMGLGDVTFMLMIGSFLGWQAVVMIFILAPLTGLLFAIAGKLLANRPYLPYGPCLAAATLVVLLNWSWLWLETRLLFSDLVAVAILAAAAVIALVVLLLAIRGYRSIPTRAS